MGWGLEFEQAAPLVLDQAALLSGAPPRDGGGKASGHPPPHSNPPAPSLLPVTWCGGGGGGGAGGSGPRPRGKQAAGKGSSSTPSAEGLGRWVVAKSLFVLGTTGGAEAPPEGEGHGRAYTPRVVFLSGAGPVALTSPGILLAVQCGLRGALDLSLVPSRRQDARMVLVPCPGEDRRAPARATA